jgi:hypothetical protein
MFGTLTLFMQPAILFKYFSRSRRRGTARPSPSGTNPFSYGRPGKPFFCPTAGYYGTRMIPFLISGIRRETGVLKGRQGAEKDPKSTPKPEWA